MDLFEPICTFFNRKGKISEQLGNIEWKQDLMFLCRCHEPFTSTEFISTSEVKIGSDLAQTIFSFQNKIKLFHRDINTKSLQHFPLLKGLVNSENDLCSEKIKVCIESVEGVSANFVTRFSDLERLRPTFALCGKYTCC